MRLNAIRFRTKHLHVLKDSCGKGRASPPTQGKRDRNGVGVSVYIKDTLSDKSTLWVDVPKSSLELLCVEIKPVCATPFFVIAWYRQPNTNVDTFEMIEECLQFLDREDKEIILLGDTNCGYLPLHSNEFQMNFQLILYVS